MPALTLRQSLPLAFQMAIQRGQRRTPRIRDIRLCPHLEDFSGPSRRSVSGALGPIGVSLFSHPPDIPLPGFCTICWLIPKRPFSTIGNKFSNHWKPCGPRAARPQRNHSPDQSSTWRSGTRPKWARLWVTRRHPSASAEAAMSMSMFPMGCPTVSRWVRSLA